MVWEDEGEVIQEEGNLEGSSGGKKKKKKPLGWPCGVHLLMRSRNGNRRASPRAIEGNICLVYLKPHSWSVGRGQFLRVEQIFKIMDKQVDIWR